MIARSSITGWRSAIHVKERSVGQASERPSNQMGQFRRFARVGFIDGPGIYRGRQEPVRGFDLKLYFGLLAASLLGTLAIIPFSMTLTKQMDLPVALLPVIMAVTVVVEMVVSAVAIGLGLGFGPRLGLANLVVSDDSVAVETGAGRRFWAYLGKPLAIGMALGALMGFYAWGANFTGDGKHGALTMPSPWEGLLASIGAGVREEIWLRLGLMTFLVWLGCWLIRLVTRQSPHSVRRRRLDGESAGGPRLRRHSHSPSLCSSGLEPAFDRLHLRGQRRARTCIRLALLAPRSSRGDARTLRPRPRPQGAHSTLILNSAGRSYCSHLTNE